jgi:hypothetical protein
MAQRLTHGVFSSLPEEVDSLFQPIHLGDMASTGIEAVGSPTAGREEDAVGEGKDMQDRGLDPARPPLGER